MDKLYKEYVYHPSDPKMTVIKYKRRERKNKQKIPQRDKEAEPEGVLSDAADNY
ncbi:hypothetical protein KP79_PYT22466 [Mizuhopecten yessoensis]|uniref:Uncharacterized protein n=1 Tax=Mizuhopecten yessoensis TaxID=6573 RepID=A0A210QYP7_MIZYE|nr:hypothetical protein KP79_PYT22466 [Mizuhopecten yessoensis]